MKHTCGETMFDMGEWPDIDQMVPVNRFHCRKCNQFTTQPISDKKLVSKSQEDGSTIYETVDA